MNLTKKIDIILSKLNRDINYLYIKIRKNERKKIEKFKKRISNKSPKCYYTRITFFKTKI